MAKGKNQVEETTETVEENDDPQGIRPNDLAKELGIDGKRVRAYLRSNFSRDNEAKNTAWFLDEETAAKVTAHFTKSEEDEAEEDEVETETNSDEE